MIEAYPDRWFRDTYYRYVDDSRAALAKLTNAPNVDDLILIENASSAVNSILRTMDLKVIELN